MLKKKKGKEKKGKMEEKNRKLCSGSMVRKELETSPMTALFWVPADLSPDPEIWEEREPVDTLKMSLNIQIPFATFLFCSPCPWLSPPSCLSVLSIIWEWRHVPIRGGSSHPLMEHLLQCLPQLRQASHSQRLQSVCNGFRMLEVWRICPNYNESHYGQWPWSTA